MTLSWPSSSTEAMRVPVRVKYVWTIVPTKAYRGGEGFGGEQV